jgi:iron only hydrogenase large subunit-like protein
MKDKNNTKDIKKELANKTLMVAMLAPSFVSNFSYPAIIFLLKKLGFDKVVELTFGAKLVNREYHKQLKNSKRMLISTVCPGIVEFVKKEFPQYEKSLIKVDSPMIATAKICKKFYPKHKVVFIAPCNFKKEEAQQSKFVDYALDYNQLQQLFEKYNIRKPLLFYKREGFDGFYNDYTKIYPLAGGLSKTAHLKGVLKPGEAKVIDGIKDVREFLKYPEKGMKFLDANFCIGGCIGGPCTNQSLSIEKKKELVLRYLKISKKEKMPKGREGLINKAKGISFKKNY